MILSPLSIIYRAITSTRLHGYKLGLLSTATLPVPVISVGNLTTGGTGKTPLVEWICRRIAVDGLRVCVLTRGYGRPNPKTQVVVSDGDRILSNERESGDEPFLLAENLLGLTAVISNPNRIAAGRWAIENLGTQVFVLDDGFQHLKLSRDLNIAVIDATEPWGGDRLLPNGRLREPKNELARADCAVITRTDQSRTADSIPAVIHEFAGAIPIFKSRMVNSKLLALDGQPAESPGELMGAFCGIGNGDAFFDQLRRAGFNLVFTHAFPDHYQYKQSDLDSLVTTAKNKGTASLITTAKDAIRLRSLNLPIPCYVSEIHVEIDNEDAFVELIRKALSRAEDNTIPR